MVQKQVQSNGKENQRVNFLERTNQVLPLKFPQVNDGDWTCILPPQDRNKLGQNKAGSLRCTCFGDVRFYSFFDSEDFKETQVCLILADSKKQDRLPLPRHQNK